MDGDADYERPGGRSRRRVQNAGGNSVRALDVLLIAAILLLALAVGLSVGISNNQNNAALVAVNTSQTQALFMLQTQLANLVAGLIANSSGVNTITTVIVSGSMTWGLYDGPLTAFSPPISSVLASAPGTFELQNVQIGPINFTQLVLSPPNAPLSVGPGSTTQTSVSAIAYGFSDDLPELVGLTKAQTSLALSAADQAAIDFLPPCNSIATCVQQAPGNAVPGAAYVITFDANRKRSPTKQQFVALEFQAQFATYFSTATVSFDLAAPLAILIP